MPKAPQKLQKKPMTAEQYFEKAGRYLAFAETERTKARQLRTRGYHQKSDVYDGNAAGYLEQARKLARRGYKLDVVSRAKPEAKKPPATKKILR